MFRKIAVKLILLCLAQLLFFSSPLFSQIRNVAAAPPTQQTSGVSPTNGAKDPNCNFDQSNTAGQPQGFCNPLPDKNIGEVFVRLLKFFTGSVAIVAVVVIVVAGFKMIVASGSEEIIKSARSQMTWAIIGLIIAVLAFTFVAVLQNILTKPGL